MVLRYTTLTHGDSGHTWINNTSPIGVGIQWIVYVNLSIGTIDILYLNNDALYDSIVTHANRCRIDLIFREIIFINIQFVYKYDM